MATSPRAVCLLLAAVLALAGCAAAPPQPPEIGPGPVAPAGGPEWRAVRVRIGEGTAPVAWHVDALLAEQVFAPLVEGLGPSLVLWRFHRRAAPDEAGHRFSFLFYADPASARTVAAVLERSALLASLRAAGHLVSVTLPRGGVSDGAAIGSTSDPAWPRAVRRSWPYFAMGVSRNWLALIAEAGAEVAAQQGEGGAADPGSLDEMIARYRRVNARVDALWQAHAQHAWLHHLNALYGYTPALIREQRLMRF